MGYMWVCVTHATSTHTKSHSGASSNAEWIHRLYAVMPLIEKPCQMIVEICAKKGFGIIEGKNKFAS